MGYLRKAGPQDMDLLFQWVNEGLVRKNSFLSAPVAYDEHVRWFQDMLSRENAGQYIYMDDDRPAGEIRIEADGREAEISYSICMEKRCMGYGKDMLGLLQEHVRQDFPQVEKLAAKVKPENIASQKALMDAGYEEKYGVFELAVREAGHYQGMAGPVRGGVLFLTNNRNALGLYEWLKKRCHVNLYSSRLELCQIQKLQPDLVVSYNYIYLIQESAIRYMNGRIINLHISYLPWNRGVSPNIWSFIENTPKGVTIHQVDAGFDTGKILYQKQCFFDPAKETFTTSYQRLNQMVAELFVEKWDEICSCTYSLTEQKEEGSYHSKKDLQVLKERTGFQWDENIADFLRRYKKLK